MGYGSALGALTDASGLFDLRAQVCHARVHGVPPVSRAVLGMSQHVCNVPAAAVCPKMSHAHSNMSTAVPACPMQPCPCHVLRVLLHVTRAVPATRMRPS